MMLTYSELKKAIDAGDIVIQPFDPDCLGTNSYDVHLGDKLMTYSDRVLDCKKENATTLIDIPPEGYVLHPGTLYLGATKEYTETHKHVPEIQGKSSLGRLGLFVHVTAGFGDVGFRGHWTLEFLAIHPIRIYAGMKIGQLCYFEVKGDLHNTYDQKKSAKYSDQGGLPVASKMYLNFKD